MILKYKYHSDSGLLEAFRSYTLAQNNSLSDTIVITSTASDAEKYNYCLEFICYNSKSIPKAQYISPILNYDDGISFTIPNNLTEFRGHVDMQLTGYDPIDNSIVFKSVSKNCKAFDVEGSLCVLEKDLNDTPNVFTEVLKQLEDLKHIHQDIIDEAMRQFEDVIRDRLKDIKPYRVRYYDNGRLIAEKFEIAGAKLTPPQYELPEYCVLVGGWYNPDSEELWNLDEDTVEGDLNLYLNYMTDDVVISQGVVQSFGNHNGAHIYVPEYYDGYKVCECAPDIISNTPSECHIHFGINMKDGVELEEFITSPNVIGIYFPDVSSELVSKDGYIYINYNEENVLAYAPKSDVVKIEEGCMGIISYAICNNPNLQSLTLPDTLLVLNGFCIANTGLKELTLPSYILYIEDNAVCNNPNLKRVILKGDISGAITNRSFVNVDPKGNVTRPTLYVQPQYYETYKAKGLEYEIKVLGQEYFDGRYATIGE